MPEGPQVYRIAENLRKMVIPSTLRSIAFGTTPPVTVNSHVVSVLTKGKKILIKLDDSRGVLLAFALSGKLEFTPEQTPDDVTIAKILFSLGEQKKPLQVALVDPQHIAFAVLDDFKTIQETRLPSGFDPLHTVMGMREWLEICKSHSSQLTATFLTTQSIIAGIGNRYRSEIMHVARIRPDAKMKNLSEQQLQLLLITIYRVLKPASRGEYIFQVYGRKESMPDALPVFRREVAKGVFVWTTMRARTVESTDGSEGSESERTI